MASLDDFYPKHWLTVLKRLTPLVESWSDTPFHERQLEHHVHFLDHVHREVMRARDVLGSELMTAFEIDDLAAAELIDGHHSGIHTAWTSDQMHADEVADAWDTVDAGEALAEWASLAGIAETWFVSKGGDQMSEADASMYRRIRERAGKFEARHKQLLASTDSSGS